MLILHCEDSLEGIFTAIYDAFVYKKQMKLAVWKYHNL